MDLRIFVVVVSVMKMIVVGVSAVRTSGEGCVKRIFVVGGGICDVDYRGLWRYFRDFPG